MEKLDVNVSKYYTPTIDEFYIGFEYERYIDSSWEELIFDIDYEDENWNDLFHTNFCIANNTVRVKYLDKTDIESLGFVEVKALDEFISISKHTYCLNKSKNIECLTVENNLQNIPQEQMSWNKPYYLIITNVGNIWIVDSGITGPNYQYSKLFSGIIKNKSELVKLLKQLGINE